MPGYMTMLGNSLHFRMLAELVFQLFLVAEVGLLSRCFLKRKKSKKKKVG